MGTGICLRWPQPLARWVRRFNTNEPSLRPTIFV
jgi:hypothetical protein